MEINYALRTGYSSEDNEALNSKYFSADIRKGI